MAFHPHINGECDAGGDAVGVVKALGQVDHRSSSKQEIALGHRQYPPFTAGNQFTVDTDLIGLRINGDVGLQTSWIMSAFFHRPAAFHHCGRALQIELLRDAAAAAQPARQTSAGGMCRAAPSAPNIGGNAPAAAWG